MGPLTHVGSTLWMDGFILALYDAFMACAMAATANFHCLRRDGKLSIKEGICWPPFTYYSS